MTERSKGVWALGTTFALTALITAFKKFESGYVNGIWVFWVFWSWNYFAYAFNKRMLPWQFVELKGGGEGRSAARTTFFWGTLLVYVLFLAVMAFAD